MLNSTIGKTIFTKRWMLLGWFAGMAALVAFTMAFYPSLSKSFSETINNVPDSLKAFIGNSENYTTVSGYADLQVFFQFSYIVLIAGVILFTGELAGEENDGTLQTLLAQPISRGKIYIHKLIGSMVVLFGICFSLAFGILITLPLIHGSMSISRLILSVLDEFLIVLLFSSIGYTLGAATGKRAISGAITGALAFTSLLITSLAESVKSLKPIDKFSPFHYFDKPGILLHGPRWSDMILLTVNSLVILVIGFFLFKKRDIYQR